MAGQGARPARKTPEEGGGAAGQAGHRRLPSPKPVPSCPSLNSPRLPANDARLRAPSSSRRLPASHLPSLAKQRETAYATPHQRIIVSATAALKSTSPPTLTHSLTACAVWMPSGPKLKVGVPALVKVAASCQLLRPAGLPW